MNNVLTRPSIAILVTLSFGGVCGRLFAQAVDKAQNASAQSTASAGETTPDNFLSLVRDAQAKTNARQWDEAVALWDQVGRANPVQVSYWLSLAGAAFQARNYRKAIPAYEKVIELRGGLRGNAAYNIACCYALMGEKEQAVQWLQKALDMGFRNLTNAQADTNLQSLRDDARYQKLLGLTDDSKMSREQGWRTDLDLFAREVRRRGFGVPRKISAAEFDAAVQQLSAAIPKLTDMQIVIEFAKLAHKVGDGHTNVFPSPQSPAEFHPSLPLKIYLF